MLRQRTSRARARATKGEARSEDDAFEEWLSSRRREENIAKSTGAVAAGDKDEGGKGEERKNGKLSLMEALSDAELHMIVVCIMVLNIVCHLVELYIAYVEISGGSGAKKKSKKSRRKKGSRRQQAEVAATLDETSRRFLALASTLSAWIGPISSWILLLEPVVAVVALRRALVANTWRAVDVVATLAAAFFFLVSGTALGSFHKVMGRYIAVPRLFLRLYIFHDLSLGQVRKDAAREREVLTADLQRVRLARSRLDEDVALLKDRLQKSDAEIETLQRALLLAAETAADDTEFFMDALREMDADGAREAESMMHHSHSHSHGHGNTHSHGNGNAQPARSKPAKIKVERDGKYQ